MFCTTAIPFAVFLNDHYRNLLLESASLWVFGDYFLIQVAMRCVLFALIVWHVFRTQQRSRFWAETNTIVHHFKYNKPSVFVSDLICRNPHVMKNKHVEKKFKNHHFQDLKDFSIYFLSIEIENCKLTKWATSQSGQRSAAATCFSWVWHLMNNESWNYNRQEI